jgi:phenylalanyl-tRNA synthetase beta chain
MANLHAANRRPRHRRQPSSRRHRRRHGRRRNRRHRHHGQCAARSAYFATSGIRRTSRRLGLSSDSSYRFERGIDPQQVQGGSELATKLILSIAGGTAEDVRARRWRSPRARPAKSRSMKIAHASSSARPISAGDEIHAILEKLGLTKKSASKHESHWLIPSYRLDLQRPVDLIEEIARVIGSRPRSIEKTAVAVAQSMPPTAPTTSP